MNILIFLSGGIGTRMKMGDVPKQYLNYRGYPIFLYSLMTFNSHPMIDKIVLVAEKQWREMIDSWIQGENIDKFYSYADPGENRQLSILNGLKVSQSCCDENDTVIIHDAARPNVSGEMITRCLKALKGHDGVMPILRAKDTYYLTDQEGRVSQLLPRPLLAAGQAPEVFRYGKYYRAHLSTEYEMLLKICGSSEIAVKEGMDIITVPGDEYNIKITTKKDLKLLDTYMTGKEE